MTQEQVLFSLHRFEHKIYQEISCTYENETERQDFSSSNLRKYKYAILWGSNKAKSLLPTSFYNEMDKFLVPLKKDSKKAAKDGLLDEHESDPISWTLFQLLLKWAIEEVNMLVWVFSLLQWNCMSRSRNIGDLAYHNFRTDNDYIKIRYDNTKADQSGDNVKDKHVYANPFNPLVCPILALGIWFSLESKRLGSRTSILGLEKYDREVPSTKYTRALSKIMQMITHLFVPFLH